MSAPASLNALRYRVLRTEAWGLSKPGRFAAVYVRGGDSDETFVAEVTIDGRPLKVAFVPEIARRRALIARAQSLGLVIVPVVLLLGAIASSVLTASDREDRIQALEAKAERAEAASKRLVGLSAQAKLLQDAGASGHRIADVLEDIDWLTKSRAVDAHIQAVHWEGGLMTVTARGESQPVQAGGREIRRAPRPLAPSLYLWGIGPGERARTP